METPVHATVGPRPQSTAVYTRPVRGQLLAGAFLVATLCGAPAASAGEVPEAIVTLEVIEPAVSWRVAEAAPLRFALLERGRVYVGSSTQLAVGVLDGSERKELEKRAERVAKQKDLPGEVRLGPGDTRYRLHFPRRGVLVMAVGAPEAAPGELRRLGMLVEELRDFDHHTLVPWAPLEYLLSVARRSLPGGCRTWRLDLDPEALLRRSMAIPAAAAPGWTTGAVPTAACHQGQRFAVTLRPLVPGES